jgi:hypothetical protein
MFVSSVELRLREPDALVGTLARIVSPPDRATPVKTKFA